MKRHKQIISQFNSSIKVDNLYLDSNSIIYDVVYSIKEPLSKHDLEDEIIHRVCRKLLSYLHIICPKRVFIAFDGVPPMAKMKQQRERRYKSWLTSQWLNETKPWDTVQITPGTPFMKRLDKALVQFFEPYRSHYSEFYLSPSNEIGEGEHKLFSFIRDHPDKHHQQHTMIYGLDSDLIILSLNHLSICSKITLLREAPAFNIREINKEKEKELHTLDINQLSNCITTIMGKDRLYDYIFMTLLLGNDFMPHFPALNLRTTGMDTLLNTYVESMKDKKMFDGDIHWDNVKEFISALSKKEHDLFVKEQNTRNKRNIDQTTLEKRVTNLPMLKREKEYIIDPNKSGWQTRYYTQLFPVNTSISDVGKNYVEMLEWNIRYYTTGCKNWSLYYHYAYPPLLEDLVQSIPERQTLVEDTNVISSEELLSYVLPSKLLYYMDNPSLEETIKKQKSKEPTLIWSYCTYLWESHLQY